jgi:hypothetical protein
MEGRAIERVRVQVADVNFSYDFSAVA